MREADTAHGAQHGSGAVRNGKGDSAPSDLVEEAAVPRVRWRDKGCFLWENRLLSARSSFPFPLRYGELNDRQRTP